MTEPVRQSIRVACAPAHAFRIFTEKAELWWPPGHLQWADSRIVLEPRVGGRFFEAAEGGEVWVIGEVTEVDTPHRLRMRWFPGRLPHPSEVTISFAAHGAETAVEVVHVMGPAANAGDWSARAAMFAGGWERVLGLYEALVEGKKGGR